MPHKDVNATRYVDIPSFSKNRHKKDGIVNAIIETPKGSAQKYALRPEYGIIEFHEVMPNGLTWPYDYGFIPQTLAKDGDALDILVINEHGYFSGCFLEARVLGIVREDKNGTENDRIIAVPLPSPGAPQPTDEYREIRDVPETVLASIHDFLLEYSTQQRNIIDAKGVFGADDAMKEIRKTMKAFRKDRD